MALPETQKRIIVAITGASGALIGVRALELLKQLEVETHLVISEAAQAIIRQETGRDINDVKSLATAWYEPHDLSAPIASGSYITHGMLVAPCSIKTLSAIANSYTESLIARAADVCLKEGRPLLLAVREAPFHYGHLRLMILATRMGAVIYPPIPFFYGPARDIDGLITQTVARMLLRLGIDNSAYPKWMGIDNIPED